VRVPTLIVHNAGDGSVPVEYGRYMAERIPGAKYVELRGDDHLPWVGNADAILDEVEEFLTGARRGPEPDRVLATVMFTDIVGARVAALAGAGEVLVSSTVRDLVAGSGLRFTDRGAHALKGVAGEWHLFAVGKDIPS